MKRAAEITGLDSVSVDMKDKKLTVTGDDFDPVKVVSKLRKLFHTDIVTVGEPKKPEAKKEEPEAKKTEEGGKDKKNPEQDHPVTNITIIVRIGPSSSNLFLGSFPKGFILV
ncbi:Heavy metal-associated isoprenylated plant protein 39 [Linum perenne]